MCADPSNDDDQEDGLSLREDVQVIGMSATMPNVAQVCRPTLFCSAVLSRLIYEMQWALTHYQVITGIQVFLY